MTIREALRAGSRILAEAQIRTGEQDARLLLQSATGLPLARILAHPEIVLRPEQEERFAEFIRRRSQFYPIQYLSGEQEFFGRNFKVTPAVLIPRPETEVLVEQAIMLMTAARAGRNPGGGRRRGFRLRVRLSGSRGEPSRVTAIDISEAALDVARANAARLGCLDRIEFLVGDTLFPYRLGRDTIR